MLAIGGGGGNEREALIRIDDHRGEFFLSLGLQAVAYFALAAVLYYLARATMARRAEGLKYLWPLIFLAPVLLTVGGVLTQLDLGQTAEDFVSSGAPTNARAEDLLDDRSVVSGAVQAGGTLFMAVAYVLVSINAMRAGLLSRFMGVLGVIVGALLALPLIPGAPRWCSCSGSWRSACCSWVAGRVAAVPPGAWWRRSRGPRRPTSRPPGRRPPTVRRGRWTCRSRRSRRRQGSRASGPPRARRSAAADTDAQPACQRESVTAPVVSIGSGSASHSPLQVRRVGVARGRPHGRQRQRRPAVQPHRPLQLAAVDALQL